MPVPWMYAAGTVTVEISCIEELCIELIFLAHSIMYAAAVYYAADIFQEKKKCEQCRRGSVFMCGTVLQLSKYTGCMEVYRVTRK